jgi:hypothetical protein
VERRSMRVFVLVFHDKGERLEATKNFIILCSRQQSSSDVGRGIRKGMWRRGFWHGRIANKIYYLKRASVLN